MGEEAGERERREAALLDLGKLIASASLTLGAVLLTAFGVFERIVGFERLAGEARFALAALLPGGAALAFLATARALGTVYDLALPPRRATALGHAVARSVSLSGAYGLFAFVISALIGVSVGLAVQLLASDVIEATAPAMAVGSAAFLVSAIGMLTHVRRLRAVLDGVLIGTVVAVMLLDRWTT